jgi:hydroxymethylglutaryl-CoA reductase (NADPH)
MNNINLRDLKSIKERRNTLEQGLGQMFPNIGSFTLDESMASTRNCENMIGVTQIPLGIAGPLLIKPASGGGQVAEEMYYLPLATTEGALVASISRGCKAITESGGASVQSYREGASRGPVFKVKNLVENSQLFEFIISQKAEFDRIAKTTSSHITLTKVETNSTGLYRFVRFTFDTQDAMGLNMVTIATDQIVSYIETKTQAKCISLSGNFCVDKKPSWLNFTHSRGIEVWAEVTIPENVVNKTLKTTSADFYQTWLSKCMIGTAMTGSMGFNAQFANILAAMFIACGQDPAHVAECAIGMTTSEITDGGLYISVFLPDLMVGTVGGGTGLATQNEALSILGVAGGNDGKNSVKLAEIIAGAVLAGEISLLASLSVGTLAQSHQRLARGGK